VSRVKRLRENETRSSGRSHEEEDARRSTTAARRSRSRDRRHSRVESRSTADKPSPVRLKPYAAGLAAQLSQRRKQLEARAKEKLKLEKETLSKLPAVDSDGVKIGNSLFLKETSKPKVVIEIHDDDEQNVTECQTEQVSDFPNSVLPVSVKSDDTSLKDDDTSGTSETTPSSNSASTTEADNCKSDAVQVSEGQQTGSEECHASKSTSATLSLMNLPMPPVASESDSEATPISAEEL